MTETNDAIGHELTSGAPWTRHLNNVDLSAVEITLAVPALSVRDRITGEVQGHAIDYRIETRPARADWDTALEGRISGKTTAAYQRTHRIDLPEASADIRVTRLTPNRYSPDCRDVMFVVVAKATLDV